MMGTVVFLWLLLETALVIGFAYIIWVLATKESGMIRFGGMALSALIKILAIILFIYVLVAGNQMKSAMKQGMMGCPMMGKMGDGGKMKMEMMKKNPDMMKIMKEKMEKKGAGCK